MITFQVIKELSFKTFLNTDMPTAQKVFAFKEDMQDIMEDQIIYADDTLENLLEHITTGG